MLHSEDISINYEQLDVFYNRYFAYYRSLQAYYKKRFVNRCLIFLNQKYIDGINDFEPDNRIKALIAASAVQLTLGLECWEMDYFDLIIVHPQDYKGNTGLKFSGETNLAGYVKLSWKTFLRGYTFNSDNINLGLHEFSHALHFSGLKGGEQDYFLDNYFNNWLSSAYEAFNDLKLGRLSIFRPYGGTNINEFISVCFEHFFESPQQIKETYPLLYYSTACLLNQLPDATNTQLNVRAVMMDEKSKLLPGLEHYHFSSPVSAAILVAIVPLIYTVLSAGLTNVISLCFEALFVLLYLRYDFSYTQLTINNREFEIKRGCFIFKSRKQQSNPIACLISFRSGSDTENGNYELIFYDTSDERFYEEDLNLKQGDSDSLIKALKTNRITYYEG